MTTDFRLLSEHKRQTYGEIDLTLKNDEFCAVKEYTDSEIKVSDISKIYSCGMVYITLDVQLNGGTTSQNFDKLHISGSELILETPKRANSYFKKWRKGQDLNLRTGCPVTRFPSVRLKPLGHPSVLVLF